MRSVHRIPFLIAALYLLQWRIASGFSQEKYFLSKSTLVGADDNTRIFEPLGTAVIDYSTATEYIQEHYGIQNYFGKEIRRTQPVYDARKGVLPHCDPKQAGHLEPARLENCGFELFMAPTQVQDFQNLQEVQKYYVKELEDLIPKALGVSKDDIETLVFWHPTLRGEELSIGSRSEDHPGLGPIASRVHIDTDVGAYGLDAVCNLVDKNRVDALNDSKDCNLVGSVSIKDSLFNSFHDRRRMLLLNIWRPLVPVSSAPLGLLATKYDRNGTVPGVFPNVAPSSEDSHWYIFSNMRPEECLIFKQYDRRLDKQSDIWHCALNVQETKGSSNEGRRGKRISFDIKAFVVLREHVPQKLDRLEAAIPPALTWEESGEFCDNQAHRLNAQKG
ncbi:hypothetical protein IV203_000365 [Nitzschia inconspicua]|uniref:Uncharacterized protein n=1 Tax=Nitzschia inconspicua TaxID=303405 RepID=A0A9K3PSF6_9STRA|nr:hypothetical protein IV203_000365 [Nitzschia inconspicua]